ncbi:hypothetical protein F5887DRAFT_1092559 [Amanita rubescens]|nr:hypothetical protein F5887DRAFT_1092559 [Amanita rubescens]
MPTSRFFSTPLLPSTGNTSRARIRQHTTLNKDERAVLRATRQHASENYQKAIHEISSIIEEKIATVAQAHRKNVKRVRANVHMAPQVSLKRHSRQNSWNAFTWMQAKKEKENIGTENGTKQLPDCLTICTDMVGILVRKTGKDVLPDIVTRNKDEYATLTQEVKDDLVKGLEMAKTTKAKGFQPSARSRINDVTTTLTKIRPAAQRLSVKVNTYLEWSVEWR